MTQLQARYNYLHDLLEKCQDIINYVVFIWCCGNEEMEKYARDAAAPTGQSLPNTYEPTPVERVNGYFDQSKTRKVPSLDELIRFETGN